MRMSNGRIRIRANRWLHGLASVTSTRLAVSIMLCILTTNVIARAGEDVRDKEILGWIETALVTSERIKVKAKLDTGAKTTSLHAINIKRFKRDGRRMVRFTIEDPETGELLEMERPLVRSVRIKESIGDEHSRRPVVELWLCVGSIGREVEVNLVDRSRFIYPLLIGRSAMAGLIVVDSEETFTLPPDCPSEDKAS
ncbi:MAG: ATP-dependent zinc protease [Gammaproteobacteria bacterium]